jgi:hypothetical protein
VFADKVAVVPKQGAMLEDVMVATHCAVTRHVQNVKTINNM